MSRDQQEDQIRAIKDVAAKLNTPDRRKAWLAASGIAKNEKDKEFSTKEKAQAFLEKEGIGELRKKDFLLRGSQQFIQQQIDVLTDITKLLRTPEEQLAFLKAGGIVGTAGDGEGIKDMGIIRIFENPEPDPEAFLIEPKIRPVVDALNDTGIVKTFTSCQGHFGWFQEPTYFDRKVATVGFELLPEATEQQLERLFAHIQGESENEDGAFSILTYKNFAWDEEKMSHLYFFEFYLNLSRFAFPWSRRKHTDRAIVFVTNVIRRWIKSGMGDYIPPPNEYIDILM